MWPQGVEAGAACLQEPPSPYKGVRPINELPTQVRVWPDPRGPFKLWLKEKNRNKQIPTISRSLKEIMNILLIPAPPAKLSSGQKSSRVCSYEQIQPHSPAFW